MVAHMSPIARMRMRRSSASPVSTAAIIEDQDSHRLALDANDLRLLAHHAVLDSMLEGVAN